MPSPTRRSVLGLLAATPVAGLAAATAHPAAAVTAHPAAAPAPAATGAGDVVVRDLTVPVRGLPAVPAYLVRPGRPVPRHGAPAVLFLHWFDPRATDGDRTEFVAEAVRLAGRGVVSLLPQQGFPWTGDPVGDARDVAAIEAELTRAGAALAALAALPEVDASQVVIVGHGYGAMYAALLAAREPRVAGLVALTPDATWEHRFLAHRLGAGGPAAAAYPELFADLQPLDAVAAVAAHRPLLLQFGEQDRHVDAAVRARFAAVAEPRVYPRAGHRLDRAALTDRAAWLDWVLRLPG
jgi:dienelactone hydrolase